MGELTKKLVLFLLIILLNISFISAYKNPPYTPSTSLTDIKNVTISGCAPPATLSGCANCFDGYKQDCVYYFASSPSQCPVVYDKQGDKESCYYFVFREKVKSSDAIISTCKLFETSDKQNSCFMYLVPEYGDKHDSCNQISTDTDIAKSYKDSCLYDFAFEKQDPSGCGDMRFVDSMIDCCTRAKGVKEQYITTRQDLIDSFTQKHPNELKECKLLLGIKQNTVDGCEDLNCECLSPCNNFKNDANKQQKCAKDC